MKLVIGNTVVKMKDGLYCLNDLHKASGGEKKNGPSYWSALSQTKDFLETTQMSVVKLEGRYQNIGIDCYAPVRARRKQTVNEIKHNKNLIHLYVLFNIYTSTTKTRCFI